MHSGFVSEVSTRKSSLAFSYSDMDITSSEIDMEPNVFQDADIAPGSLDPANVELMTVESERDPIYFCENVVLKAGDRVFCVPKSGLFEHGNYFQSIISQDSTNLSGVGSSETHPIILEGVSKIHFHNFLRLIYPFRGIDPPSGDEHWLGILDLSTKWGFHEIRGVALTHLEHIFTSASHYRDPVRALYLCKKYDIHQHIKYQYETLITSITPLDRPAMLAGGIDEVTILELMQLRERWFCGMVWGGKGTGTGFGGLLPCKISARRIVEDHFSLSSGIPTSITMSSVDAENAWKLEEAARLDDAIKRLEDMEIGLIAAEMKKAQAEAEAMAEEAKKKAEEEAERARTAQQSEGMAKDGQDVPLPSSSFEMKEPKGLGQPAAADDLDDIQSVTSDMSVVPSPEVGPRLERLILLRGQKYQLEQQIEELKAKGVDESNPRMEKLTRVVDKYGRKLMKCWEKGIDLATNIDDGDTITLDSLNEVKSSQKVEERLERLLHPDAKSLTFSVLIGNKKATVGKQKMVVAEIREYYGFLPYTVEDAHNRKLSTTIIPEEKFGEWLAEFRRLASQKGDQEEPVPTYDDPWGS